MSQTRVFDRNRTHDPHANSLAHYTLLLPSHSELFLLTEFVKKFVLIVKYLLTILIIPSYKKSLLFNTIWWVILNLAKFISFYSVTKISMLSPLNVMNRFTVEQRWHLLEIYFQNRENLSEIARKWRVKFDHTLEATVPWFHCWCAKMWAWSYIQAVFERMWVRIHQHQLVIVLKFEHFMPQFTSNFAKAYLYEALQKSISSRAEWNLTICFVLALLDGPTGNSPMLSILPQKKKKKHLFGWSLFSSWWVH